MQIVEKLHRTVEKYRQQHGRRPGRILLKGEMAQTMAITLCERRENLKSQDLADWGKPTPDELFLDGGVCYFKGIPVIAELEPDEMLIVQ